MAYVSFTRSTDATAKIGTTTGLITFNTANRQIYLGTGSEAVPMDNGLSRIVRIAKSSGNITTTTTGTKKTYSVTFSIPGIVTAVSDTYQDSSSSTTPTFTTSVSIGSNAITTTVTVSVLLINTYSAPFTMGATIYYLPIS